MTSVFIGGSRRLNRVNADIAGRLDNIIAQRFRVLIGDANGFDHAAQAYLAGKGYPDVVVYCTSGECRNNVGEWPARAVEFKGRSRGFDFYAAKDDAMTRDADYALFAWDARSKGTLRNICNMARLEKPSAVYVSPKREFVTVRSMPDAVRLAQDAGMHAFTAAEPLSDAWRATG